MSNRSWHFDDQLKTWGLTFCRGLAIVGCSAGISNSHDMILPKFMKRTSKPLKDERRATYRSKIESNQKEIDTLIREVEQRLLPREQQSNSVSTLPGGRPESNRRKF